MFPSPQDLSGSIGRTYQRMRRRALLSLLARQTPEKLIRRSEAGLLRCFRRAAARSPAYRTLLAEAGVTSPRSLSVKEILDRAPILDKASTFGRFPLHELIADDISAEDLAGILTSSGYGGSGFAFGLSTHGRKRAAAHGIDLGLELAFSIDRRSTLVVNCLPMGVVFSSEAACIANVSVREDMALAIMRRSAPLFRQFVLCADPLFLKRFLDYAGEQRMDWSGISTHVILGGETFPEEFRSYVAGKLGIAIDGKDPRLIGSTMGTAELGLNLFFETPETVALRRAWTAAPPPALRPTYFCYDPLRSYVEIVDTDGHGVGELVITVLDARAPIPLVRYRTGDLAYRVRPDDLRGMREELRTLPERLPFPIVALVGRRSDWVDPRWHVDHFKALAYRDPVIADELSGAFRVRRSDSGIELEYQQRRGSSADPAFLARRLGELSAADAGDSRAPRATCLPYGDFPQGMSLDYERKFAYLVRTA